MLHAGAASGSPTSDQRRARLDHRLDRAHLLARLVAFDLAFLACLDERQAGEDAVERVLLAFQHQHVAGQQQGVGQGGDTRPVGSDQRADADLVLIERQIGNPLELGRPLLRHPHLGGETAPRSSPHASPELPWRLRRQQPVAEADEKQTERR